VVAATSTIPRRVCEWSRSSNCIKSHESSLQIQSGDVEVKKERRKRPELGYRYAERNLWFINRGIRGNRVLDLAKRWQADVLDLKPDVLSILIGINDTFFRNGETLEQYETTYNKLIADTLAALPKIRSILGEPFLPPVGKFKDNYQSQLAELKKRQDVVDRLTTKYYLPLIRYQ